MTGKKVKNNHNLILNNKGYRRRMNIHEALQFLYASSLSDRLSSPCKKPERHPSRRKLILQTVYARMGFADLLSPSNPKNKLYHKGGKRC